MKREIDQKFSFRACPDQGSQRCVLHQSPVRGSPAPIDMETQIQEFQQRTKNSKELASPYCIYEQYIDGKGEPKFPMCQLIN